MIAGLWAITGLTQVALPITKHSRSTSTYWLTHKVAILVNSITSFSDKPLVLIVDRGTPGPGIEPRKPLHLQGADAVEKSGRPHRDRRSREMV